jgi:hypothetical protein
LRGRRGIDDAGRVPLRLTVLVSLSALATALVAAPAAPAARDRCAVARSKTVKQTSAVRVLSVTRKEPTTTTGNTTTYYGCLRSTGRRVKVGSTFNDPSDDLTSGDVQAVLISGTSVALTTAGFEDIGVEGSDFAGLGVANLARGGRVYRVGISTNDEDLYSGFAKVLLRADGTAAWVIAGQGDYDEVDVLGATAKRPTPVAYAKGILEKSLAFGGEGVTWTQAGATQTAAIP